MDPVSGKTAGAGGGKTEKTAAETQADQEAPRLARSAFPWLEKGVGVDGQPLSKEAARSIRLPGEEFNRKYAEGLKFLENEGDLGKALTVFEDIVRNFPGTDEAGMACYRIAQIHFRNKANNLALQTYKTIVKEYPTSPIAENARSAIVYLENFEKHEKAYVAPEEDDRLRRGW
jgi:TolA-binding protein